ncbi:kinase-like domain-containing protein [Xylaria palmicola]|nr:kinase-like domain-containing protein [Xylaria palmicola]
MIKYDTDELSGAEDARDDNIFSTEQEIHETDNIQDTELEMHEMDDFQDAQHETDVFHDAQQQIHDTDDFQDAELEMHEMDDFQDAQQEIHETDDFHDAQQEIHDTDDLQDAEQEIHDTDDYQEYEYDYLEERCDLEDITKYNKGGFHPVHINDILNDRFEVIHKLGSGGFGTVWLCRDCSAEKWRALKILTANHSSRTSENKIFEFLERSSSREELEKNHITIPLESFWIDGPNGRHICQVMEIHGYPVDEWRHERDSIFPSTRKDSTELCRQMTEALDFLHSKGICHGDFRPSNILMKIDQAALHKLDVQQMLELVGEADAYTVYTTSGKDPRPKGPQYCVIPVIRSWCVKLLVPEIVVVDFGESFFLSDPSHGTGIPMLYAAPEIIFRQAAGTGVDIWSLACTVFEIRTGEQLFPGDFFGPNERSVVHDIEIAIGPLAAPYRERWDRERLGRVNVARSGVEAA